MTDEIISIHKVFNPIEADLIKSQLEALEIPCYLKTDDGGGTMPHLTLTTGIQIMVREKDANRAKEVLEKS